jgi:hypothetical protein
MQTAHFVLIESSEEEEIDTSEYTVQASGTRMDGAEHRQASGTRMDHPVLVTGGPPLGTSNDGMSPSAIDPSMIPPTMRKTNIRSISKELKDFPLPADIKRDADAVYMNVLSAGARKVSKRKLMCYAIHQSYLRAGHVPNMQQIADMVGIPKNKAVRGISYYLSPNNTPYRGISNYIPPLDLIASYGKRCRLTDEAIMMIKQDYINLIMRQPETKERPIVTTIAALIYCYNETNGIHVDSDEFMSIFDLRSSTIGTAGDKILSIQNGYIEGGDNQQM